MRALVKTIRLQSVSQGVVSDIQLYFCYFRSRLCYFLFIRPNSVQKFSNFYLMLKANRKQKCLFSYLSHFSSYSTLPNIYNPCVNPGKPTTHTCCEYFDTLPLVSSSNSSFNTSLTFLLDLFNTVSKRITVYFSNNSITFPIALFSFCDGHYIVLFSSSASSVSCSQLSLCRIILSAFLGWEGSTCDQHTQNQIYELSMTHSRY